MSTDVHKTSKFPLNCRINSFFSFGKVKHCFAKQSWQCLDVFIVGRGFLTSLFCEDPPYITYTPFFQILSNPQPFSSRSFCCLASLAECFITPFNNLFNNSTIQQISSQKHLGIHLDEELTFKHHINGKINKANKGIGIICKLNNILPCSTLLTIYRSFIWPHLDYSDVIYDQPESESFSSKIESVQYNNASLAIAGAVRGTSQEKLYQELGLEFRRSRRWLRCMCYFYKLIKTQKPLYLFSLILPKLNSLRHPITYSVMRCRNDYFKNSFIPYVVREWNKLCTEICNSTSYQQFRKSLLSSIKPTCSSLFSIHHPVGVKLLVRLRLGFSHLRGHKFGHNFHDTLNPLCSCSLEPETTSHYVLRCHNFPSSRLALINDLNLIDPTISQLNETALANIFSYVDSKKSTSENSKILQSTIRYIIATKRFDDSLF